MGEIEKNLLKELKQFGEFTSTPGEGCSRLPFTAETRQAADCLLTLMKTAGLTVKEDEAGNLFGILEGENPDAPCVMSGSHYDSVYHGGNYDGIAGVLAAVEAARELVKRKVPLKRNFVVAAFMDEEGCRFGTGYFGSKCMLGEMTLQETKSYKDQDGISVYEAMKKYGLVPEEISRAKWKKNSIGDFLEIHIEQGPVLESEGMEIGIVDGIVGIRRYSVVIYGMADHAGTTPMNMRKDAVDAAGRVVAKIGEFAREEREYTVATVGKMDVFPNAVNVIAERAEFTIDVRSMSCGVLERMERKIKEALKYETVKNGMKFSMKETLNILPAKMDERLVRMTVQNCQALGYKNSRIKSGAGHDALAIGQTLPAAMIFVPSKAGRSHCKEEYTDCKDLEKAANVLIEVVKQLQGGAFYV